MIVFPSNCIKLNILKIDKINARGRKYQVGSGVAGEFELKKSLAIHRTARKSLVPVFIGLLSISTCAEAQSMPMLSALEHRDFATLEKGLGDAQSAYENGRISDTELRRQFLFLYELSDKDLNVVDDWAQASPKSYVAQLALAIAARNKGGASRGDDIAARTPAANFRNMNGWFAVATRALDKSMSLTKKPLMTILNRMSMLRTQGDISMQRKFLDEANKIDPNESVVRTSYMTSLAPRWGGSVADMVAFEHETRQSTVSPKVADLVEAVMADELSKMAYENGDRSFALFAAKKALSLVRQGGDAALLFTNMPMASWYCHQSPADDELQKLCWP